MAENVIRQDVIEIGFDIDLGGLNDLTKEFDDLKKDLTGGIGDDAFDGLTDGAKDAQKEADKLQGGLKNLAKTAFTKLTGGLGKVLDKLDNIANKAAVAAFKALKKVAGVSFKVLGAGIAGAATATAGLVGGAVTAYADYEQLIGGVETLFKDNAGTVEKYANDAYKTAGLSANQYMETVTSFSASLLQSLDGDTQKAAKYADMAITDMSDNANKMGTSMESIQYAYQGFAKQNYTMLDNLKLGYGGTKEEMQRLLKDAEKISGQKFDLSSYGDIVQAIHIIQEDMGIAGTTAKEASETISGSLASMKSAWGNLLPALIKGGDSFDQCVENLVSSVKTFAKNVKPAIKTALTGVSSLISELAPEIAKEIPSLVADLAPSLATAGVQIVVELGKGISENGGTLVTAAKDIVVSVVKALYEGFTGQKMGADELVQLKVTINDVFSSVKNIVSSVVGVLKTLAPVFLAIGKVAIGVFNFLGNNINWLLPLVISLVAAFKTYKVTMTVINAVTKAYSAVQKILSTTSTALAAKLPAVAAGTKATGTASATSASQVSTAATAFLKMGLGILAIGAGVLLAAAGFWVLTQAAISLAGAGWGAIAVMVGMVAAIALLAWGASFLGAALTAGAVGFLAFGGAVLMIGAGFALIGVGAMLAASGLQTVAGVLPTLVQYGLSGSIAISALGLGLTAFAVGAALAGAAALVLGAGLLVVSAALLIIGVALALVVAMAALMSVCLATMSLSSTQLAASMAIITPMMLLLSGSMASLSASMLIVTPMVVLFTATMTALMAVLLILSPLALLFSAAITMLAPAFAVLGASAPAFKSGVKGLAGEFTKIVIPAGLLAKALNPLAEKFSTLATAAVSLQSAVALLVTGSMMLSLLFAKIAGTSTTMVTSFVVLGATAGVLAAQVIPLAQSIEALATPLQMVAPMFLMFAKSVATAANSSQAIVVAFMSMSTATAAASNAMQMFVATLRLAQTGTEQTVAVMTSGFGSMVLIVRSSGLTMVLALTDTLRRMETAVYQVNFAGAGSHMMNGLILGMNSRRAAAISTARSIAEAINKEYRKVQDINSPSGEWENYGAYQIQGDINGMEKNMPKLQTTVQEVGEMAMPYAGHYTPESTTTYSNSLRTEYNTYSPQFSFTVSGTNDDRVIARKVKRAVAEAWAELLTGYESKMPQVQEV